MNERSYLKDLVLLRNDPATVEYAREAARRGEVDALYALGLIYAEGRGVAVDQAQAHYWLSLAVERGDKDAEILRNFVGARMTAEEHELAARLRKQTMQQALAHRVDELH